MSALLAAINAETAALQAFVTVLEEEQKLLISGDADAVLPLLERKTALITELGVAGQQRETALQAQGISSNKESLEGYFAGSPQALKEAWQQLLVLAQSANQLNTTNGKLINTRLQHNQAALSILMNAAGSLGENATYGPDGHQKHGSGSRPLGSA